jgi:hypothetical protein
MASHIRAHPAHTDKSDSGGSHNQRLNEERSGSQYPSRINRNFPRAIQAEVKAREENSMFIIA